MEREIKEFETKGGVKIKANAYITGREMRELRDCYIQDGDVQVSKKEEINISGVNAEKIRKYEDMAVKFIILSVNEITEEINKLVGDLPLVDYEEIMDYVLSLTNLKKDDSDTLEA